jgi:hypothetical protein
MRSLFRGTILMRAIHLLRLHHLLHHLLMRLEGLMPCLAASLLLRLLHHLLLLRKTRKLL